MKFNWGTGIFLFMLVFVLANVVFIIFAFRQEVNLVEENYYEKGVDYGEQMEVIERSKGFIEDVHTRQEGEVFYLNFENHLSASIDSGSMLLYRPSSKKYDLHYPMHPDIQEIQISRKDLIRGRYEIKLDWWTEGLRYEVNIPISVR